MKNLKVYFTVLCMLCTLCVWAAEESIYTCGFESSESFTSGTDYQSTVTSGPTGKQWTAYYGTTSTSSPNTGSQSMALRLYSSNNYGYAKTNWKLSNVTKVSFSAKASTSNGASIKLDVQYSTDGTNWNAMVTSSGGTTNYTNQSVASSKTTYTAYMPSSVSGNTDVYIRFAINSGSTKPSKSNAQLTIDDVEVFGESGSTKTDISLELSYTSTTLTVGGGNSSNPTVTGNTGNGTCTYSLENVSPAGCATINSSTGVITPVSVGTATAKVTIAETSEYNAGTATCAITINAAPAVHRTVTWYVNSVEYTAGTPTTDVEDGSKVTTLPTEPEVPGDCSGKVFVGWTNSKIEEAKDEVPQVLFTTAEGSPKVSGGNVKYYAVFADEN